MKTYIKGLMVIALVVCCFNISGCVSLPKTYSTDIRPIYPKLATTATAFYKVIDTLQPELRWTDIKSKGETYDVCVWETPSRIQDESLLGLPYKPRDWGTQIYYVQGINDNHVKVTKQLKPNTCYHWSVRIRKGNNVYKWGTFSQGMLSVAGIGYGTHFPYGFITPQK